jgi:hypothetical protein
MSRAIRRFGLAVASAAGSLWILFTASDTFAQEVSPSQQVSPSSRQVSYAAIFGNHPFVLPKWDNGFLISWIYDDPARSQNENLVVYDRDGKLVGKTRLWPAGATTVRIRDADIRSDGEIAVVGHVINESGQFAAFMAEVSIPAGKVHVVQTSPFEGQAVTFGPDGTIWVLGYQTDIHRNLSKTDHYLIEEFGKDDVLLGQYLPRSEFPCSTHPAMQGNGQSPRIAASADRVGFYAPACRMWVELSASGKWLGQWRWQSGPLDARGRDTTPIMDLTLTSTNEVYAVKSLPTEYSLVRLDRGSSTWTTIDTSAVENEGNPFTWLEGSDGDSLVYLSTDKRVAWTKLQSTP